MKTGTSADRRQPMAWLSRIHPLRRFRAVALASVPFLLASCGGGGDAAPPSASVPLIWDQAQATWDNVTWQ